ncbi:MAG: hypothetical protein WA783_10200 [Phormidesmis sp.]
MKSNVIYSANLSPINQAYSPLRLGYAVEQLQHRLSAAIAPLFQDVVTALTDSSSLRVWASKDAAGQTVWNANDRMTGKAIRDVSESEMRTWLESRYAVQ